LRKDDTHKSRNGPNFFGILRAGPWFLQICPWALLFRPLQSSVPYHEVHVVLHLHPSLSFSCSCTLGFAVKRRIPVQ
ncbi:hypothetical protein BAE44_0009245, partial [Dichanthelium oligosanthes]